MCDMPPQLHVNVENKKIKNRFAWEKEEKERKNWLEAKVNEMPCGMGKKGEKDCVSTLRLNFKRM